MSQGAVARERKPMHVLMKIGLGLMALAVVWWAAYYGQHEGSLSSFIDVTLGCLTGYPFECANFQDFIGPSSIPVYQPPLFWAGTALAVLGLFLGRKQS